MAFLKFRDVREEKRVYVEPFNDAIKIRENLRGIRDGGSERPVGSKKGKENVWNQSVSCVALRRKWVLLKCDPTSCRWATRNVARFAWSVVSYEREVSWKCYRRVKNKLVGRLERGI